MMPIPSTSSISIAIGGISHETHAFSEDITALGDFEQGTLLTGNAILDHARGSDSAMGGIIEACPADVKLVPALFATAMAGGPLDADTWSTLSTRLLMRLRTRSINDAGLDGVILILHGAMATVEEVDPEGALVEAVRGIVGAGTTIVVVLDSHANPTERLVSASDAILSYRTYPLMDAHATGAAALSLCRAIIRDNLRPTTAIRRLPALLPLTVQRTNGPTPIARVMRHVSSLARLPGVLQANVMPGFPYADIPHAGATVTITTDNDRDLAESLAGRFSESTWQFVRSLVSAAVPLAGLPAPLVHASGKPVVYADISDNPAAGAPGDHTGLLRHALDQRWPSGAIATICDPDAVSAAHEAGIGAAITIGVGGNRSSRSSRAVHASWSVTSLAAGNIRRTNQFAHAPGFGRTAALQHDRVTVVVADHRQQVLDPSILAIHQIDLGKLRWLGIKSSVHFRAAFEPLAASVIEVDSGGCTSEDFHQFPWRHLRRPILPLDSLDVVNRERTRMARVGAHV